MDGHDDAAGHSGRRIGRRALGLLLGLAVPTAFFTWLLGFDALKKRVNGQLWCSDADEVVFDVKVTSSGSSTRSSDTLTCRKGGTAVRTIGDVRMTATNIGVAFLISLLLLALLVIVLWTYARLRRARRTT